MYKKEFTLDFFDYYNWMEIFFLLKIEVKSRNNYVTKCVYIKSKNSTKNII